MLLVCILHSMAGLIQENFPALNSSMRVKKTEAKKINYSGSENTPNINEGKEVTKVEARCIPFTKRKKK